MTHNLTSSIDLATESITISEEVVRGRFIQAASLDCNELVAQHYVTVIQTKDAMIRAALIRLGWTPPPEGRILHSRREGSDPADLQRDDHPPENQDAGGAG